MTSVWREAQALDDAGLALSWILFVRYWRRYMVVAAIRCRLRARMLCGNVYLPDTDKLGLGQRQPWPRGARRMEFQQGVKNSRDLFKDLAKIHTEYYRVGAELVVPQDLSKDEEKLQRRAARREFYRSLERDDRLLRTDPRKYKRTQAWLVTPTPSESDMSEGDLDA